MTNGKLLEQSLQAENREDVAENLKAKGLQIVSIKKMPSEIHIFGNSVSTFEKANLCRYLAVMLKSGLSLADALDLIYNDTENQKLKGILHALLFEMQRGGELSKTLKRYPETFDPIFLALVEAGEQSGSLEKTFAYLADQLYAVHRLGKKISGAMMYPLVIFMAMGGVGVIMMTFVLPRLGSVFLKMKIPLPTPTRILLETGKFMGDNVFLVLGSILAVGALVFFLFTYYKTRKVIMAYVANTPIIKNLFQKIDLARFARTLATLLKSGVPIMKALQISSQTFTQFEMQRLAKNFDKGLLEGKTVASLLMSEKKIFPAIMIQTIETGEKTGTLDEVLLEISEFYEAELEDALKEFTTILEPIIMLIIGVAVGTMVVMIIAPIYSVMGSIQGPGGGPPR